MPFKKQKRERPRGPYHFAPHPGQQTKYFLSTAKIVIAGGGAGGGKTHSLLMEAASGVNNDNYDASLFRQMLTQHKIGGGLRAESQKHYKRIPGAEFNKQELLWEWASTNAKIKFYGCDEVEKYDGLQTEYLGIDQVEQLTAKEFWYLQSRVRTSSGRPTKIRCTCNPEPGWLEELLKSGGYVGPDGLAVEEMDGVVRWMLKNNKSDEVVWRDTQDGFGPIDADGFVTSGRFATLMPKSFTFIRFRLEDNPSLPREYIAELQSMPYADRRKKLEGNWNQWRGVGLVYRAATWGLSEEGQWWPSSNRLALLPQEESIEWCWAWDIGWSSKGDWSYGVLMGQGLHGWYVADAIRFRCKGDVTFETIRLCSVVVGKEIPIVLPKDPGKGGLDQEGWAYELGKHGHVVSLVPDDGKTGDKVARHRFLAPQAERGRLKIVTDWRPTQNISEWLLTREAEPGKMVECSTASGWDLEFVMFLDALSDECAHAVTDCTDALARGHRYLMENTDPISDVDLERSMLPAENWPRDDPRRQLALTVTSSWSRAGLKNDVDALTYDPDDFLWGSPYGKKFF